MKEESGVMVMKKGKAWGTVYADGQSTAYGWVDAEDAPIHDPKFCTKPTDVTYKDSPDTDELNTGRLVHVIRTTRVQFLRIAEIK